jgi:hypothetical protein
MDVFQEMQRITAAYCEANGLPVPIHTKSREWHEVREDYVKDATAGRSPDWAHWDEHASAELLLKIQALITLPPEKFKTAVESLITGSIAAAAVGHADQCEKNGVLYDIAQERARR